MIQVAIVESKAVKSEEKPSKLSLYPENSEDMKLSLSEDRSIEVEQTNENKQNLEVIDEEYVDPLDQYMMDIEGQAAAQIDLPKNNPKKVITFE